MMIGFRRLSAEEIMRLARARFVNLSSENSVGPSSSSSSSSSIFCSRQLLPEGGGAYFDLLDDNDTKDVELAHLLLASAEKVDTRQFDRATKLLDQCLYLSSNTGNVVQRVVYCFANALLNRIDRETGRRTTMSDSEGSRNEERIRMPLLSLEEAVMCMNPALIACFQRVPFFQVLQFAGVQAIVDSVAAAKKVHIIDLAIRSGVHCTVLMQALATRNGCPLELLKITAVGTTSRLNMEETGKRLASFADTLNLPFSFNIVMVSNMKDIKEDMFELLPGEVISVYSPFSLNNMIGQLDCFESLMQVLKNLDPSVMVVMEVDADHSSAKFMECFIEALYFYSAFFECLEVCMDHGDQNRMVVEGTYMSRVIENIVATEGEERIFRYMKIDGLRDLLTEYGMVETELSMSSLYQANLVVKQQFACGNSCTLDMDGKCLIVGWKGTPIVSVSVWKFQQDRHREKETEPK